jgi:NAD(P)-dependent dehydrogenase (short-subunit alcohol dehydrogenase family)
MPQPRVAIVTGAGSGIGRATCELLADAGYRLTMAGRNEQSLLKTDELLAEETAQPPETLIVPADVSDREQAQSIVDLTMERWGRIDGLVNNAAILVARPIDQTDEELLFGTFAVNMFGPAYLAARCWPIFVKQAGAKVTGSVRKESGACVVNVSSMASIDPFNGLSAYAASKAALESLTRSIVNEGRAFGMRAFSVAPGAVETAMLRSLFDEVRLPPMRTLDPQEVAQVIVDCVEGRRENEMGKVIVVKAER